MHGNSSSKLIQVFLCAFKGIFQGDNGGLETFNTSRQQVRCGVCEGNYKRKNKK